MAEREPGDHVHKVLAGHKIKKGDDGRYTFTISTGRVDRDNDTINPNGWQLTDYRANPVVLFGHQSRMPPIGRAENVGVRDGALKADVIFAEPGTYPLADTVKGLVDQDILRATSVGFIPTKWSFDEKRNGFDFLEQELYEFSIVPIPSNADALRASKGVDLEPLEEWAEDVLTQTKGSGLWVPPGSDAELMRKRLDMAKAALREAGGFSEDEVSDDIAPRIIELLSKAPAAGEVALGEAHAPADSGSTPEPATPRLRVIRGPKPTIRRFRITRDQIETAVQNAVKEECQAAVRFAAGRLD